MFKGESCKELMIKRWIARGSQTTKAHHSFSDWWGQLDFQQLADSVGKQVGL